MDFTISDLKIIPLKESKFVRPFSISYTQDGKKKRWDCVEAHDSVSCLLYHREFDSFLFVRQFRPSVWYYQEKNQIQTKNGLTYELCAGIMDKGLDTKATMIEEIIEETGYSLSNIERVTSSFTALGFGANSQTLFYGEIDESMKVSSGGGVDDEKIELVFIKQNQILNFIYDESKVKAPNLQFSILWWMMNKKAKFD
ncbi:NUDIX hydrolase [Campylobacter sp. CX2-8023-23]|uniref:NUDIX hydrolase n=1 Tax=Campylobacter porcelli TaxID=1660073 RepID=UPI002EB4FCC0|nr:NUDIX hydrolase [Campylobacter sp. CX2-8023-23]MEE3777104.1 NUDIX hydrolase [Campylobacter sp. CX2-4080-23]